MSGEDLFKDIFFENINSNYYLQKPELYPHKGTWASIIYAMRNLI